METEAELALLLKSGCDEAQGYFFSKPLPAEQLQAMFGRSSFLSSGADPLAPETAIPD